MHTITFQSKFYFGDHVGFYTEDEGAARGTVIAITVDEELNVDYTILLDGQDEAVAGITANDMSLLR